SLKEKIRLRCLTGCWSVLEM
ncbi:hypothetical protein A2U01_0081298, partial [Trifolium medium]|nr:hypothetical protein [Trifolium medium]